MMTTDPNKLELVYWFDFPEWYTYKVVDGEYIYTIKPDAPERIRKSYEAWEKQKDN